MLTWGIVTVTQYSDKIQFQQVGEDEVGKGESGRQGVWAEKESPFSTDINIVPTFAFTSECFFSLQKEVKSLILVLINTYDNS